METTLVILKPDAVDRRLAGEIIKRFESKGLDIVGMKLMQMSRELAKRHYEEHKDRPFFGSLIDFITSGPVVVLALSGHHAIEVTRALMGKTNCAQAAPGTIRGDLGLSAQCNLVHGSDSEESAASELGLFFTPQEIVRHKRSGSRWFESE